jgi:hypothetical protein
MVDNFKMWRCAFMNSDSSNLANLPLLWIM